MKRLAALLCLLLSGSLFAQEVLLPVRFAAPPQPKGQSGFELPFFDDFCDSSSFSRWSFVGAFPNHGYAPLPPTVGMVTLDAYDADGNLYPQQLSEKVGGDTLLSVPLRLDSVFYPYPRRISADDSLYLSFYFTTGGGYGNYWERSGDTPEKDDSLLLQFYAPQQDQWRTVWRFPGLPPDSLRSWYGTYWPQVTLPITEADFLQQGFRFRFVNYCSLDNVTKVGYLANADQWNIDYVYLDLNRHCGDTAFRDVAFVNPAQSMLRDFQSMPFRQFAYSDMRDSLSLTIANLFSEELAAQYGYSICDQQGTELHRYEGGFENVPPFMPGCRYQTSPLHARPPLAFTLPVSPSESCSFDIVHSLREGVGGSSAIDRYRTRNDTVAFHQRFDYYYAYDDGSPENGYGLTSTNSVLWLAVRFPLRVEDTLTAIDLYFNTTYGQQNASVPFLLTVWDDGGGRPGNCIYQDSGQRKPRFEGFNRFVRYFLEEPLVCNGTIYVGLQQNNNVFLNLGFDRNNDASSAIFYMTSIDWQTSILKGSLMLRPCFGQRAFVTAPQVDESVAFARVWSEGSVIKIRSQVGCGQPVQVFDLMGRRVFFLPVADGCKLEVQTPSLRPGLYLVRIGTAAAHKVIVKQ